MRDKVVIWVAMATDNNEDESLQQQREDLIALCENRNWEIIDILEVPVRQNFYLDFKTCASEMKKQNVDAFTSLEKHWEAQDFDILMVRDKRRFSLSQALFAYIVERTIKEGSAIYSRVDGLINEENYRLWLNMVGFGYFDQFTKMKERRQRGVEARLRRGLPTNANLPISHVIVRDERTGKALHVELNPATTQMWQDLSELIFEGLPWKHMGRYMHERYGHVNAEGKPYPDKYFYRVVYNPCFWGHGAMGFKHQNFSNWVYDEFEPVPEGITIYRNIYPAVWTGEFAETIKAELRQREMANTGRKKPAAHYLFDDLFLCAECGHTLKMVVEGMWTVWRCKNHPDITSLKDRYARQYIEKRLRQMLEDGDPFGILKPTKADNRSVAELRVSQHEIDEVLKQLERLLLKQASVEDAVLREAFDNPIQETYIRFQELQAATKHLWEQTTKPSEEKIQKAYRKAEESIDVFWNLAPAEINQTLHDLMGNQRFVVADGEIIGIAEAE